MNLADPPRTSGPVFVQLFRSDSETSAFAQKLAQILRRGDCLLLSGPVGAGKSHFARAVIRELLLTPEDIPSPTFTLVQTYDTRAGELWHCDLYRLSHPDEAFELGLSDAMETAICLIEWPDRLGGDVPADALQLGFSATPVPGERRIVATAASRRWTRALQIAAAK